jgi:hypothetical protein
MDAMDEDETEGDEIEWHEMERNETRTGDTDHGWGIIVQQTWKDCDSRGSGQG